MVGKVTIPEKGCCKCGKPLKADETHVTNKLERVCSTCSWWWFTDIHRNMAIDPDTIKHITEDQLSEFLAFLSGSISEKAKDYKLQDSKSREGETAILDGDIREFGTGATRDTEKGKLDFEGFLSPAALFSYAEYLHKHRLQPDGSMRGSDNWQQGMDRNTYIKSLWRHLYAAWAIHRGYNVFEERKDGEVKMIVTIEFPPKPEWKMITIEDALCGIIFNAMGYLHEETRSKI